jgi:hypothetical protein
MQIRAVIPTCSNFWSAKQTEVGMYKEVKGSQEYNIRRKIRSISSNNKLALKEALLHP